MNVLAADIGGTNANLALIDTKNMKTLLEQHTPTKKIVSFETHVQEFLTRGIKKKIIVTKGCFAIAGPITEKAGRKTVQMSNTKLTISETILEKETTLTHARIINDFEAIGYAINVVTLNDVLVIRPGRKTKEPCVVIGAGTGLGKVLMVFDEHIKKYLPVKSEVGHTDFPVHNERELHIIEFIKLHEKLKGPVTYEHVLSGNGLENLYEYYAHKRLPARLITQCKDAHARDAVTTFIKFYARCFRNEIIDSMALGGAYIAGGIAAANPGLFGTEFLAEINQHHTKEFRDILQHVPITLITNYDISLKGAAVALEVNA